MQNYTGRTAPRKQDDGSFIIFSAAKPDAPLPVIDTNKDYGLFVRKAIEQSSLESGTVIHAYSELQTYNDLAHILSEGKCSHTSL